MADGMINGHTDNIIRGCNVQSGPLGPYLSGKQCMSAYFVHSIDYFIADEFHPMIWDRFLSQILGYLLSSSC